MQHGFVTEVTYPVYYRDFYVESKSAIRIFRAPRIFEISGREHGKMAKSRYFAELIALSRATN